MAAAAPPPPTSSVDSLKQYVDVFPDSGPSRESYVKFVEGKSPDEVRWWSKDTVAVVTGGNKGIGFQIVKQLAKAGVTTILTARDKSRGEAAVATLKAEGLDNVLFYPLEVSSPTSAAQLASWLKEKFGGFDILVGNAGIAGTGHYKSDYEAATALLNVNYDGQKIVAAALLPLLKPSPAGARVIFVSSELGQLQYLESEKLKEQLNDVDHLTQEEVDSVGAVYLEEVKQGKDEMTTGFAKPYKVTKILLNAYSRILAKSLSSRPSNSKVYVNSMTPGLTTTDLNGNMPGRTVENGADTAVWLALFPSGGPNGGFFRDRADCPF